MDQTLILIDMNFRRADIKVTSILLGSLGWVQLTVIWIAFKFPPINILIHKPRRIFSYEQRDKKKTILIFHKVIRGCDKGTNSLFLHPPLPLVNVFPQNNSYYHSIYSWNEISSWSALALDAVVKLENFSLRPSSRSFFFLEKL